MSDAKLTLRGLEVHLLPERAAYVPDFTTLLAADLHLGKEGAFRAAGIALPGGATADTLAQLSQAVARTGAKRVALLGDLFHNAAALASAGEELAAWRMAHPTVELQLVPAGHDHWAGELPASVGIELLEDGAPLGSFALRHYPEPADSAYVLAGHLHPGCGLPDGGRLLKLPCFHFGSQVGVLPAMGVFTGLALVRSEPGDGLYAVAEDAVVPILPWLESTGENS